MRFSYSTADPSQSELDSLPRLPLTLRYGQQQISALGLVDSGATVNVLPYGWEYSSERSGLTAERLYGWLATWGTSQRCR